MRASVDSDLRNMIAHHDSWAATYDGDMAGMVFYNRITWDNIRRFLPDDRDGVILDAGGGTGFWAVRIAEQGYRVMLVDIATGMLDKARENIRARGLEHLVEIDVADIRDMRQFADGRFAMVISEGDAVGYCGDHEAAFRELARVVRPGGAVIVSVDNRAPCAKWFENADDVAVVEDFLATGNMTIHPEVDGGYLIHTFTPEEITQLFESNGLCVERILGKPVIAKRLGLASSPAPDIQERLCRIELRYCDDPAFYPLAGHIEIAGRKR